MIKGLRSHHQMNYPHSGWTLRLPRSTTHLSTILLLAVEEVC